MRNITKHEAFLIFLNNLYIDLNCNDVDFLDILSNKNSKVFRIANLQGGASISVSRSILELHLNNFKAGINETTLKMLAHNFINENYINKNNKMKGLA